jgi:hypothetical protein
MEKEKKSMKKNKAMRLAAAMMALTLVTTSVVSGTFAKYVSEGTVNDTARVAKWGVVITTSGSLYSNAYYAGLVENAEDGTVLANAPAQWDKDAKYADGKGISVTTVANNGENILAPGTQSEGDGLQFNVSGTPEVSAQLQVDVDVKDVVLAGGYTYAVMVKDTSVTKENFDAKKANLYVRTSTGTYNSQAAGTFSSTAVYYNLTNEVTVDEDYAPVQYTMAMTYDGAPEYTGSAVDVAQNLAEVFGKDAVTKDVTEGDNTLGVNDSVYTARYTAVSSVVSDPNTDLATTLGGVKLTWAWDYDDEGKGTNDLKDTILGDMIAEGKAKADGATSADLDYAVVVEVKGGTFGELTYNADENTAEIMPTSATIVVASLYTSVDISVSAVQID